MQRRVHELALELEVLLERLHELHRVERGIARLCEHEPRLRGEITRALAPLGPGGGVGRDERREVLVVARLVAARAVHLGDLEARLDGNVDGLRELREVALVDAERGVDVARLLVELAGRQQRLALELGIRRFGGHALVLGGRERGFAVLAIDERELLRRFGVQLVIGKRRAEPVEDRGGRRPILKLHERRRRVVLRGRPDRRRRRAFRDPQEVARRGTIVLRLVGLLGLLVDRRREIVDERLPPCVLGRRQRQHLGVRGLGRAIVAELGRRMRDDGPRRAPQRGLGRRIALDQRPPGGCGGREILERVEVLGRGAENDGRMLVIGERIGKPQRAHDGGPLELRLLLGARAP